MSETNPTTTNVPDVLELKKKHDDLKERAVKAAQAAQSAIPVTGRSQAAQEAFLLTLLDIEQLGQLGSSAEMTFDSINLQKATPEQIQKAGGLVEALSALSGRLIDSLVKQLGVAKEIVMPTLIKDLARQIDLIEMLVVRTETSLKAMQS